MARHGSKHRHLCQQVLDAFKDEGQLPEAIQFTSTTKNTQLEMGKYSHGFYHKTTKDNKQLRHDLDAGYMSDPHTSRSQTGYDFTSTNAAISWRSVKQTMSATSTNHAKILTIHEASRKCVWLRSVIQHICESCGISSSQEAPTVVHEDNAACIAQLKDGYIKADRTKHILPKFFFTHDLQKSSDIIVQNVCSSDN
ncbi:hypothetical protein Tco_0321229 [Tanacetum coccineum]